MSNSAPETPVPSDITLHRLSRTLELRYEETGERFDLPCEYLRVFTPSAEARGHAPGQEKLPHGCAEVTIERLDPIGHYALRLIFSDGHDTGIYSWDLLYDLCRNYQAHWQKYLKQLEVAGLTRQPGDEHGAINLDHWRQNKNKGQP